MQTKKRSANAVSGGSSAAAPRTRGNRGEDPPARSVAECFSGGGSPLFGSVLLLVASCSQQISDGGPTLTTYEVTLIILEWSERQALGERGAALPPRTRANLC